MKISQAETIMLDFAERTGIRSGRSPERYLWTDAFAVCNLIGLSISKEKDHYRKLAQELIDQVHGVLGRYREDDERSGWLSGLGESEGARHPTRGGLRIGKPLPERRDEEPFDRQREWDRDGQYFHYLTKWMMALSRYGEVSGDNDYLEWAIELAEAAYDGFVYQGDGGALRMYWKMSTDLTRPLVPSMGHHDPLDGYVTYRTLTAGPATDARLTEALRGFEQMVEGRDWTTSDPLGLGGLLMDVVRLAKLRATGAELLPGVFESTARSAIRGLRQYQAQSALELPATRRLAFRELGLAIGLAGAAPLANDYRILSDLEPYLPMRKAIISFWKQAANREVHTWTSHQDINDVMLATALEPSGVFGE
jgi:hypothetical protein